MNIKQEWKERGFIDEPIDEQMDLKGEIKRLCREKDAIILAHYYTVGEIQEIAHFVGDSLALARKAAETEARVMVMCGVHFMAETCKLDRKSTRLNSSHANISYAVFCLKKNKTTRYAV